MSDSQPAPDFEEARMVAETILADDTEQGSVRIPHVRRNLLARTVLALLREREAREKAYRKQRDYVSMALRSFQRGYDDEAQEYMRNALQAALPATESAQAEGERARKHLDAAREHFTSRPLPTEAQPPDRNSGHSPEEVVDG